MARRGHFPLLVLALAACLLATGGIARADRPDPDRLRTECLVVAYGRAEGWPVKALVLLSLGARWHPCGAAIVREALGSRDPRLRAYAIEALSGTPPAHLRQVLVPELLEELVEKQLRERNPRVRMSLLLLLAKALPEAEARTPSDWVGWWCKVRDSYQAEPWVEQGPLLGAAESKTVPAPSIVDRAFDLSQGGIQLVLVVDSTGSMQPTIDAVRLGLRDVVSVLSGIASNLELGLVHYKDHADFSTKGAGGGAHVLSKLTRSVSRVQKKLDRLAALGGGDWPERVAGGLWLAYQADMGWRRVANKMVIVIGDAPPRRHKRAVELAKKAREEPETFLKKRRRPTITGPRKEPATPRPFLTSTVAVGLHGAFPDTEQAFQEISRAGGGVYAGFRTAGDARKVSSDIVRLLIELSFGERYIAEARRFVETYYRYRDAGFIPK